MALPSTVDWSVEIMSKDAKWVQPIKILVRTV